jgi:hypothetical protein
MPWDQLGTDYEKTRVNCFSGAEKEWRSQAGAWEREIFQLIIDHC